MKSLKTETKRLPFLALVAPMVISLIAACNDGGFEEVGEDADEAVEEIEDAVDGD